MAETLLFNALRQAIDEEMGRDETVFVLGEDVGHYGGSYKVTKDLYKKYGDLRILDTPIAENSFTGMAVGAAIGAISVSDADDRFAEVVIAKTYCSEHGAIGTALITLGDDSTSLVIYHMSKACLEGLYSIV